MFSTDTKTGIINLVTFTCSLLSAKAFNLDQSQHFLLFTQCLKAPFSMVLTRQDCLAKDLKYHNEANLEMFWLLGDKVCMIKFNIILVVARYKQALEFHLMSASGFFGSFLTLYHTIMALNDTEEGGF